MPYSQIANNRAHNVEVLFTDQIPPLAHEEQKESIIWPAANWGPQPWNDMWVAMSYNDGGEHDIIVVRDAAPAGVDTYEIN